MTAPSILILISPSSSVSPSLLPLSPSLSSSSVLVSRQSYRIEFPSMACRLFLFLFVCLSMEGMAE